MNFLYHVILFIYLFCNAVLLMLKSFRFSTYKVVVFALTFKRYVAGYSVFCVNRILIFFNYFNSDKKPVVILFLFFIESSFSDAFKIFLLSLILRNLIIIYLNVVFFWFLILKCVSFHQFEKQWLSFFSILHFHFPWEFQSHICLVSWCYLKVYWGPVFCCCLVWVVFSAPSIWLLPCIS